MNTSYRQLEVLLIVLEERLHVILDIIDDVKIHLLTSTKNPIKRGWEKWTPNLLIQFGGSSSK